MRQITFEEQKRNKTLFKLIMEQFLLYEGLIKTYSKEETMFHLKILSKSYPITYELNNGNNIGTYSFKIIIQNDETTIRTIIRDMNTYGYYVLDCDAYKDNVDNFIKNIKGNEITLNFEPKFAPDVTDDIYEKYNGILYHITESKNINKIQKNGLTPKTKNMVGKYPDRIYFFIDIKDYKKIKDLIKWCRSDTENLSLLVIKLNDVPYKKFFYDNNLINSVFTLENVIPNEIIDIIEL